MIHNGCLLSEKLVKFEISYIKYTFMMHFVLKVQLLCILLSLFLTFFKTNEELVQNSPINQDQTKYPEASFQAINRLAKIYFKNKTKTYFI